MISREHRFHGYASLRYVYKQGKTMRTPLVALKFVVNDRRQTFRCAVVVSKKVNKSAVVRNRIRRRIYEQVRNLTPQISAPYDMVMTVYSEQAAIMPATELAKMISGLLRQAHIIAREPFTSPLKDGEHDSIKTKTETG